jgi:hypothetical protein
MTSMPWFVVMEVEPHARIFMVALSSIGTTMSLARKAEWKVA